MCTNMNEVPSKFNWVSFKYKFDSLLVIVRLNLPLEVASLHDIFYYSRCNFDFFFFFKYHCVDDCSSKKFIILSLFCRSVPKIETCAFKLFTSCFNFLNAVLGVVSYINFHKQCLIMTLVGGGGCDSWGFEIQKSDRIWKFIYCYLLLLYISNHRWRKIVYRLRK